MLSIIARAKSINQQKVRRSGRPRPKTSTARLNSTHGRRCVASALLTTSDLIVTLTFDLLSFDLKITCNHYVFVCKRAKIVNLVKFLLPCSSDGRTHERTDERPENTVSPPPVVGKDIKAAATYQWCCRF